MFNGNGVEDSGLENPLAVYVRNVPYLLLSDNRFKNLLNNWSGVDVTKSACFNHKKDNGVNGWAIVSFKTEAERNRFLEDENQHYVRDTAGDIHKLKVAKWFSKPSSSSGVVNKSVAKSNSYSKSTLPLYKENIFGEKGTFFEDFENKSQSSSITCFKGVVQSYVVNDDGHGHNGFIEIDLIKQERRVKELVLFHSGSLWLCHSHSNCFGADDCIKKCGVEDDLPARLKVGSEVVFTARKIPVGFLESCRFQAKSVWQGEASHPNFVSPPSNSKLDEYLEDYLDCLNNRGPSPPSVGAQGGSASATTKVIRHKPLKGSLNQLNSSVNQSLSSLQTQKKVVPSNFAQAVASAAPLGDGAEVADFVEKGEVESFPNKDEVVVFVSGHGRFILDKSHFDDPFVNVRSVLKPGSFVTLALKFDKSSATKSKFDIIKAFPEPTPKSKKEDVVEEKSGFSSGDSVHSKGESNLEINFEDLDKYYDTFPKISEYLQREIPFILPDLGQSSKVIERLANDIIYSPGDESSEIRILDKFFKAYPITANVKTKFIEEYTKFRKSQQLMESDAEEEDTTRQIVEVEALTSRFLTWMKGKSKSSQSDSTKLSLYKELFSIPSAAAVWFKCVVEAEEKTSSSSFLNKKTIGEDDFLRLQTRIEASGEANWSLFLSWIESDINLFKLNLLNNPDAESKDQEKKNEENLFAGIKLSSEEREFVTKKERDQDTQTFILRAIILLRKAGLSFEFLANLHKEHLRQSNKTRNREFNGKLQTVLEKYSSQVLLDQTNAFIKSNKDLKIKEHIPISCKKIEKYIPILASSVCGFLLEKANISFRKKSGEKSPVKVVLKSETPPSCSEFDDLMRFIETKHNSHFADGLFLTLKHRNITISQLRTIYKSCKEGGTMKWNLELSKLRLNPPTGQTVMQIGESLWSFFAETTGPDDRDELTIMAPEGSNPPDLFSIYGLPEVKAVLLSAAGDELEGALLEGLEVLWPLFTEDPAFDRLHDLLATLATAIWRGCNVDKDRLEKEILALYQKCAFGLDCVKPLKELLGSWASILETFESFKYASLNVLNLLKLTLASFDFNIYEEIQDRSLLIYERICRDITSDKQHMYSAEGIVCGKLESFTMIQTKRCMVLADPLVFFPQEIPILNRNKMAMVRVDSRPVFKDDGKVCCYIATAVWRIEEDESGAPYTEPPFTGVLLPLLQSFYKQTAVKASALVSGQAFADFGSKLQEKRFYDLYWNETRFSDFPEWPKDLFEAKIFYILFCCEYVSRKDFWKTFQEKMEKYVPNPVIAYEEFFDTLELHLSEHEDTVKMKIYHEFLFEEHGAKTALSKFLEKYPSKWLKIEAHERPEEPSKTTSSPVNAMSDELTLGKQPGDLEVASLAELRAETEQKLEQINSAVGTLFQLMQESNAALNDIDKRVRALEESSQACQAAEAAERGREYVKVCVEEDGEVQEVPTNADGLLPLSTIRALYNGTSALKYRTAGAQRTWRSLVLEREMFHPPQDGWTDRIYLACIPAGNNFGYPGNNPLMRGHMPVGGGGGGGGPSLSSLSQLLVQQPAASIWGSSPAPMLGGISPVSLDFQDPNNYGLHPLRQ